MRLFVGFAFGAGDITLNLWQETVMKFKVEWSMGCEGYLDILNIFSSMTPEQRADVGDGVTMIGRWHDTNSRSGVAIMETTDLAALNRYLGQWNPYMDLDVSPVLDDEETAALAKDVLADHKAYHGG